MALDHLFRAEIAERLMRSPAALGCAVVRSAVVVGFLVVGLCLPALAAEPLVRAHDSTGGRSPVSDEDCGALRRRFSVADFARPALAAETKSSPAVQTFDCSAFRATFLGGGQSGTARIDRSLRLTEACRFSDVDLLIAASDVTLDCGGSVFVGTRERLQGLHLLTREEATAGPWLASSTLVDRVVVQNCGFERFRFGVYLSNAYNRRNSFDVAEYERVLSGMRNDGRWDLPGQPSPADSLRALSPRNITLRNVSVRRARVGIYVHDHLQNVEIDGVRIERSRVGIYLDHGSRAATIRNSCFLGSAGRESIAVDASAANLIVGNLFYQNSKGAVALYKNCSENVQLTHQFYRRQWAAANRIAHNVFVAPDTDTRSPAVIEIASRQWRASNTPPCGDQKWRYGAKVLTRDYAQFNLVDHNRFYMLSSRLAVRVRDDANAVRDNTFFVNVGARGPLLQIGDARDVALLGHPVEGNQLLGNVVVSMPSGERRALGRSWVQFRPPLASQWTQWRD